MRRRNADHGKLRRPVKRTKITDGFYGSMWPYMKIVILWGVVLVADYLLQLRFELLWPTWLLVQRVYDNFISKGWAVSIVFIIIVISSDTIFYFFIPVQYLFALATTIAWLQWAWNTERGLGIPTLAIGALIVFCFEISWKFRDIQDGQVHLDICKPFAAHSVGYIVFILGFQYTIYANCKIRQCMQRKVAKKNEFIMQLLQKALPIEEQPALCYSNPPEQTKGETTNDNLTSKGTVHSNSTQVKNSHRKSLDKVEKDKTCAESETKLVNNTKPFSHTNGDIHTELDFLERLGSINDFDENEVEKDKSSKTYVQLKHNTKWSNHQAKENAVNCQRERKNKANKDNTEHILSQKDEYCQRLEADIKRLKIDLQASRQTEQDLRCQANNLLMSEKSLKCEMCQLQLDNEELQSKIHSLTTARQIDKQTLTQVERRLRLSTDAQALAERKAKEAITRATPAKGECTESCRARRRDLEAETKQLRRELKTKEERCLAAERDVQCLKQYKENQNEYELLMSALSAMQDKNAHLENSLSAETRIKLDLFSALGEARRQLEIRENVIRHQDREMEELKAKMAEVLAVMPTDSFSATPVSSPSPSAQSSLDPNATVYTPKSSHLAPATQV